MSASEMTLRRALEMAVLTEEIGAQFYRDLAEKFSAEPAVAEVFAKLAHDEISHGAQFRGLMSQVPEDEAKLEGDEIAINVLAAAVQSEFFSKDLLGELSGIETPADALGRALALERSTLFYYNALRDVLGSSLQLEELIQAEKAHVTVLMRVILSDAKFRGLGDPW